MNKITKAKEHLTSEEVKEKIKNTVGFWRVQKWLIIYNALNYPRSSTEIANHVAVSKALVHKTISEYNRFGPEAIETKGKGGRRNANLTVDEEREFMNGFLNEAQKGQIATVAKIKEEYEKLVGYQVHKTTIYRLLARNNWRKIVPLPHHPKGDKQAQEAVKKTSV